MSFRSSFVCNNLDIVWPQWFFDKYREWVHFRDYPAGLISSKVDFKQHTIDPFLLDVQRAVRHSRLADTGLLFVFLHDCDGVSRCLVTQHAIEWSEALGWESVDDPYHDHGDGCNNSIAREDLVRCFKRGGFFTPKRNPVMDLFVSLGLLVWDEASIKEEASLSGYKVKTKK
ncbi:MAG: hypothetical protein MJA28_06385 [Gammaproteobacteria bacterium]|nr:hypothetical protein [Gammaproteobacteria bacterium]